MRYVKKLKVHKMKKNILLVHTYIFFLVDDFNFFDT